MVPNYLVVSITPADIQALGMEIECILFLSLKI